MNESLVLPPYRIDDGTTHIVWAVGYGPLSNASGLNISQALDTQYGTSMVRFLTVPSEGTDGTFPFLVNNEDVRLSDDDTTYWCSVHKLPDAFKKKHHVIQVWDELKTGPHTRFRDVL